MTRPHQTSIAAAIPVELLSEIFHRLCDKPIALQWLRVYPEDFDSFPWAAGQVCKQWRRAFLTYPALWTSLNLSDHMFGNQYADKANRRTSVFLERSRGYPLDISFCGFRNICTPSDLMTSTWRLLLENSYRWRTADIRMDLGASTDILREYRGKMPILTSLKIFCGWVTKQNFDAFEVAPRLIHLSVWCWRGMSHLLIPWAQLTKLTLGLDSPMYLIQEGDIIALLHALQNIEELRFKIADPFSERFSYPVVWPAIRLTRLRLLEVPHFTILLWIEPPVLEHLHVTDRTFGSVYGFQMYSGALCSMVINSSCYIRRLTLEHCQVMTMQDVMDALPRVEELYVTKEQEPEDLCSVIRKCLGEVDGHVYLPKLRVLRITCKMGHVNETLVEAISHLLEKRGTESALTSCAVPIEELTIKMKRDGHIPEIPDKVLDAMDRWPTFAKYSY